MEIQEIASWTHQLLQKKEGDSVGKILQLRHWVLEGVTIWVGETTHT